MNDNQPNSPEDQPATPPANQQATPSAHVPEVTQPRSRAKAWLTVALAVIMLVTAGLAYAVWQYSSRLPASSNQKSDEVVLDNASNSASKYNRSTEVVALGNVKYVAAKLSQAAPDAEVADKLEKLQPPVEEPGLSQVAFIETGDDVYTRRLVMYDFKLHKVFTVAEDKGDQKVRHYYDPVILSDHYVAWYTLTYDTPVDLTGSIRVVDLTTGEARQIIKDTSSNLPENLCCSVSPDGKYLVVPTLPNKIVFYSVGGEKAQEITVRASMAPLAGGEDNNSYAQAQRALGYPALRWLDHSRIILATGAPLSYKVDAEGTHISKASNGLDILDLTTGQQTTLVKTGTYSIPWFDIADNTLVFASHTANETLAGGPITGTVELYKLDITSSAAPTKLAGITHDKLGALVLDKSQGLLYVQEALGMPITAINLQDDSRHTYSNANPLLIEAALDSDTLIGGNRDGLTPSTVLYSYQLSTGKAVQIY